MSVWETAVNIFYRIILSVLVPAGVIVLCLYILNSFGDIKYLPASALAFGIGFYLLYLIFKYWIKPSPDLKTPKDLWHFLIVFGINLIINIEIVYLLVTYVGVPILTAQMVAAVVVAYESYYAYLSLLYSEAKKQGSSPPRNEADDIVFYSEDGQQI